MNSTMVQNSAKAIYEDAFVKIFIIVLLGITINSINGVFVFIFFRSSVFYRDPRYILYMHLVINDILMLCISVALFVMAYLWPNVPVPFCIILLITGSTTHKNTPLTLAGMAIERYIAICKPLHHPQICTVRRTYILISLIWGVGIVPGLTDLIIILIVFPLSIFLKGTRCSTAILYNTTYHEEKSKVLHGLYTSCVWVILVFTYCRVVITARRATTDKLSAKKAQNTILLHGIQLMLSMLSFITPVIDMIFAPLIPAQRTNITFLNYLLTNIIPRLLSPLIYGVRDAHFYKHIKGFFSCRLLIVKIEAAKQ